MVHYRAGISNRDICREGEVSYSVSPQALFPPKKLKPTLQKELRVNNSVLEGVKSI